MDKSINWPFHDFILNLFGTWAYTTVLEWELTWTCWILKWFLWKKAEYCAIFFGTVWVGFVPAFGRWGYWTSAGHCGCISCLSLFCIHRKQAGVPGIRWRPVVVRWRLLLTLRSCGLRYGIDGDRFAYLIYILLQSDVYGVVPVCDDVFFFSR